mmetsp:Transcript_24136/g.78589  ORF Transcript_24136/g.78589 Transcript_24136/m.78589 type:complete len:230 (-) Transcript_24136:62-751(-)
MKNDRSVAPQTHHKAATHVPRRPHEPVANAEESKDVACKKVNVKPFDSSLGVTKTARKALSAPEKKEGTGRSKPSTPKAFMALAPNAHATSEKAPLPIARRLLLEAQDILQEPILAELWLERLRREPPPEPTRDTSSRPKSAAQQQSPIVRKIGRPRTAWRWGESSSRQGEERTFETMKCMGSPLKRRVRKEAKDPVLTTLEQLEDLMANLKPSEAISMAPGTLTSLNE